VVGALPDCSEFQRVFDALQASLKDDLAFCEELGPREIQPCKAQVRARLQEARDQLSRCQAGLSPYDLTGAWVSDDGGVYLLRQLDGAVWWAGLSTESPLGADDFHLGLTYSNVFAGTVSATSISGDWADVPKGNIFNSGTIGVEIRPSFELVRQDAMGGFGATRWTKVTLPAPVDVLTRGAQVWRNDGGLMGGVDPDGMSPADGHLKFHKDNVVAYGTILEDMHVNCPFDGSRRYANFMCNADRNFNPDKLDGDLDFRMTVDRTPAENSLGMGLDSQPGFWADDWLNGSGNVNPNDIKMKLEASGYQLGDVELIMYGRPTQNCDGNAKPLIPGWAETGANSVLFQGRPIENSVLIFPGGVATWDFPLLRRYDNMPGRIFDQSFIPNVTRVRVTGVLALDCHGAINECGEGEPDNNNVEIHPVYSMEIIQPTQRADLTGVWGGSDAGTYYIRQDGGRIWWLGLSRDRGRDWANVFSGRLTASDAGTFVEGDWADIPLGVTRNNGHLLLQLLDVNTFALVSGTGGFGGNRWEKMYESNVPPGPVG
jgi:hypothetical protein